MTEKLSILLVHKAEVSGGDKLGWPRPDSTSLELRAIDSSVESSSFLFQKRGGGVSALSVGSLEGKARTRSPG